MSPATRERQSRLVTRLREALALVAPPPDLTVTQWADQNRVLSPEASSEPGPWSTDRVPYARGIMDAYTDPEVDEIVIVSSSQIAKTEIINNCIGRDIDIDPGPMLILQPTLETAQDWSKDRLTPMLRDSPCLRGKVREQRSRDSSNTILHKMFPGGHLTVVGANSPAGLAMRPIRRVFADEVDRYPASAGKEGDPVDLAVQRQQTFHDAKLVLASTPTEEETSRIWAAYQASNQGRFHVPCLKCGRFQPMAFAGLKIPKDEATGKYYPEDSYYQCQHCEFHLLDTHKMEMLHEGKWVFGKPNKSIMGFWLNQLYSPWVTFGKVADKFRKAHESGNRERLKIFWNTVMGEVWRSNQGDGIKKDSLLGRRENYTPNTLPAGVLVLTAAVDVQDSRLEVEVRGWGDKEESWGVEKRVLPGDPTLPQVWNDLSEMLRTTYRSERGFDLTISANIFVDSGAHTQAVYRWVAGPGRKLRRVFAVKGFGGQGKPLVGRPSLGKPTRAVLLPLGVDEAKATIYHQLQLEMPKPGEAAPGFIHFPIGHGYDQDHFEQLTSEERHLKYSAGIARHVWIKKRAAARNEALDLSVYNYCAIMQARPDWEAYKAWADKMANKVKPDAVDAENDVAEDQHKDAHPPQTVAAPKSKPKPRPQHRGGWARGWKD